MVGGTKTPGWSVIVARWIPCSSGTIAFTSAPAELPLMKSIRATIFPMFTNQRRRMF